ncbi:hypothetical protein T07_8735 [Trichinella nelsoni]|uniref:Uncharacterized protein n=1 Tax=Trichinella nelsoni TaxID=6336 RepID=A0A0V0SGC7_9BILA|nr:hypothetical protein T07_8735 [Trichinella nelsoni]
MDGYAQLMSEILLLLTGMSLVSYFGKYPCRKCRPTSVCCYRTPVSKTPNNWQLMLTVMDADKQYEYISHTFVFSLLIRFALATKSGCYIVAMVTLIT